ncbi:CoA transferase [Tistrella mobilis]|uniref:CaiB/BaiF CoA transferase family protein n=1 Tax=Tistrella mobilis TaxID=171437 RepID=UPI0031F713EB
MKLQGIKVVDLSLFLPGPYLTMVMADHGAEVIKVEPPSGEPTRDIGAKAGGTSVWFRNTHRGKRCVTLDLKHPDDKARLFEMLAEADVMVEAFRPGVAARLGIDYETVRAINPRIVYCAISAFGQTGPDRDRPAHDIAVEALAGVLSLNLGQDGKPTHPHIPVADANAALLGLAGVLMALLRRTTTGRGDYIDIAMLDATMAWLPNATGDLFATGRPPVVKEQRQWGGGSFYQIYETADGHHIVLGGSEHKFVETLLKALGREDLIPAASSPPGPAHAETTAFLRGVFRTRSRADWEAWFEGRDVCFAPLLDLAEAFARPQVQAREMLIRDAEGNLHVGTPIRFLDEPGRIDTRVPAREPLPPR